MKECLDYEVFLKTNGNIEKSIEAAQDICKIVLLENKFRYYKQFLINQIKNPILAFKNILDFRKLKKKLLELAGNIYWLIF